MEISKASITLVLIAAAAILEPLRRYYAANSLVKRWLRSNGFQMDDKKTSKKAINILVWPVQVNVKCQNSSGEIFEISFSVGSKIGGIFSDLVSCTIIKKVY